MKTNNYLLVFILALSIIPVANAAIIYPDASQATLYYKFDQNGTGENSTNILDWSGKGWNGTLTVVTNGINLTNGTGYDGTGSINSFANNTGGNVIKSNLSVVGATALTWGAWVNTSAYNNGAGVLSWRSTTMGLTQTATQYRCFVSNTTADSGANAVATVAVGSYKYILCTYDGSNVKIYVDGSKIQTTALTGVINYSTYSTPTDGLWVARNKGGSEATFNGSIDEAIVYVNRSLTEEEVWNTYLNYVGGCLTPFNGAVYNYPGSSNVCPGTYYWNVSSGAAAVTLSGTNMTLNAAGATFIGNWTNETTPTSYAFRITTSDNTLVNATINNFFQAIQIDSVNRTIIDNNTINKTRIGIRTSTTTNTIIRNNNFYNSSYASIYSNSNTYYMLIDNNNFTYHDRRAISFETGGNLYDSNVTRNSATLFTGDIPIGTATYVNNFLGGNNITVRDNYAESRTTSDVYYSIGYDTAVFSMDSITNSTYYNNTARYSGYGLRCNQCNNISYINNTISDSDEAIKATNSQNILVQGNNLNNITANYDGYDLGVDIRNSSNINITQNNFTLVGQGAIYLHSSRNININSNIYSFVQDNQRQDYLYTDYFEPRYAIKISPFYKSYFGNGTSYKGNINLNSSNIVIFNETFTNQPQAYLWTEAAFNITTSLPTYYYYNFSYTDFLGPIEIYLNPLTRVMNGIDKNRTPRNFSMYGFNSAWKIEQHVLNDSIYWVNYRRDNNGNPVANTVDYNLSVGSMNNSLVYNISYNLLCYNLPDCDGVLATQTLYVNKTIYHIPNYYVSVSNPNSVSPINITSYVGTTVTINSALLDNVYNVTTVVLASILPVSPVLQHSNYSENVTGVYDSGAGTFTFTATITPGDNILYLNGATIDGIAAAPICNQAGDSISTFATWLNILAIVLALGIILYAAYGISNGTLNIDTELIIKVGAGLIIAGLFITIGYIIVSAAASTCI